MTNLSNSPEIWRDIEGYAGLYQISILGRIRSDHKTDNRLINLEWCTHKENTRHGMDLGLIRSDGYRHTRVIQLDLKSNELATYSSIRQTGYRHAHIVDVCKGRRKTAFGFKWKYADS